MCSSYSIYMINLASGKILNSFLHKITLWINRITDGADTANATKSKQWWLHTKTGRSFPPSVLLSLSLFACDLSRASLRCVLVWFLVERLCNWFLPVVHCVCASALLSHTYRVGGVTSAGAVNCVQHGSVKSEVVYPFGLRSFCRWTAAHPNESR